MRLRSRHPLELGFDAIKLFRRKTKTEHLVKSRIKLLLTAEDAGKGELAPSNE